MPLLVSTEISELETRASLPSRPLTEAVIAVSEIALPSVALSFGASAATLSDTWPGGTDLPQAARPKVTTTAARISEFELLRILKFMGVFLRVNF